MNFWVKARKPDLGSATGENYPSDRIDSVVVALSAPSSIAHDL